MIIVKIKMILAMDEGNLIGDQGTSLGGLVLTSGDSKTDQGGWIQCSGDG